ncbi:hypothetical protein N7508_000068 [Penicillium antarcticum]|uniref:uncharacterized protein n=1 Tax=Penicillium antarcticum TaxID=416450 RepID=UPI00239356D2|nr:uncharacterized protein N7508_000068 [Penicillium antarcticum]KAJ5319785.1 hypothetical protein N7508_000068 [Penicillium antarcticum]
MKSKQKVYQPKRRSAAGSSSTDRWTISNETTNTPRDAGGDVSADLDIPAIYKALPSHEPTDGVIPPLLCTTQWREMFLHTVQRVSQRQADTIVAEDDVELDIAYNSQKDHKLFAGSGS